MASSLIFSSLLLSLNSLWHKMLNGRRNEWWRLAESSDEMVSDFSEEITHPTYSLSFLQTGRLVKVNYLDFCWGVAHRQCHLQG